MFRELRGDPSQRVQRHFHGFGLFLELPFRDVRRIDENQRRERWRFLWLGKGSFDDWLRNDIKNIVLVHGAWADGSGWKEVYEILLRDHFSVSIVVPNPTTKKGGRRMTFEQLAIETALASWRLAGAAAALGDHAGSHARGNGACRVRRLTVDNDHLVNHPRRNIRRL